MLTTEELHPAMTVTVDDFPGLDPSQALERVRAHNIEWYQHLIAEADAGAEWYQHLLAEADAEIAVEVYYLDDVAALLGLDPETADKFRKVTLAEGGMGPRGLPVPDGSDPGRGRYQERPWWYPETIVWWATAVGLLNPYTGEPQRLPQANTPHPPRPTVPAPDPEFFRRLVDDDDSLLLADVAEVMGYTVETVRRKPRHIGIAEGGMGPRGMPDPDDYDPPVREESLPWKPSWRAGGLRWWLIAIGRMNPYTGELQQMAHAVAPHPWRPTVPAPDPRT